MPICPGKAPNARPGSDSETTAAGQSFVAGRPWLQVRDVSRPTLTVYTPTGKNTGAAVVVFPGGGYQFWPSISKERRSVTGSHPRGSRACC
jgi:hypothetical protein